jgi:hypothetical protein
LTKEGFHSCQPLQIAGTDQEIRSISKIEKSFCFRADSKQEIYRGVCDEAAAV